jgi:RNA polymerase sigma factor (sigma-70 family)
VSEATRATAPEQLLRPLAPQVLGALVRRYGRFDACEDAVQEALLAASAQWPRDGVPENPRGWLIAVASRRLIDEFRSEEARRRREEATAAAEPRDRAVVVQSSEDRNSRTPEEQDDTLELLFLCCQESLTPASQIALTLRAVGGLSTAQIARAFLVPEATMAQRISRAKQTIKSSGLALEPPPEPERGARVRAVLHVLYLIFNEGYTASSGRRLQQTELAEEAIRIGRELHRLLPDDGEVTALLALMLLTHARRAARTAPDGALIPLSDQDRSLWDRSAIAEGIALVADALHSETLGPYQLQAAIAALHDEAPRAADTDWAQVLALYELLERVAPNPMVTLNRAVALAMVRGPEAGLALLATLAQDGRVSGNHRLHAVRGHLLELTGDLEQARGVYRLAARLTTSLPERDYLLGRASRT